jgi:serine/threonine protein kinase
MGVLMYELVAGRRPVESSSLTGILTVHITGKARPPIEVAARHRARADAIIMRCLEKDSKACYANAGALLADLDGVQMPGAAAA